METCILIPREFSIVLKAFASPPSPEHTPKKGGFPAGLLARAAVESLRSPHWDFNRNRPRLNTLPKKTERNGTPTTTNETATTTIPSPASSPEPSSDGDQPLTLAAEAPGPAADPHLLTAGNGRNRLGQRHPVPGTSVLPRPGRDTSRSSRDLQHSTKI